MLAPQRLIAPCDRHGKTPMSPGEALAATKMLFRVRCFLPFLTGLPSRSIWPRPKSLRKFIWSKFWASTRSPDSSTTTQTT